MLDRKIGFTGKGPEIAAPKPTAGEARIECERTVDQPDHGTDVLAEIGQHEGHVGKDARIVVPYLERLPCKIDCPAAGCLRLFGPSVADGDFVLKLENIF